MNEDDLLTDWLIALQNLVARAMELDESETDIDDLIKNNCFLVPIGETAFNGIPAQIQIKFDFNKKNWIKRGAILGYYNSESLEPDNNSKFVN